MAIGLTSGVKENARVHAAAESVKSLRTAAESYIASGNMTYTGITMAGLQTAGICRPALMLQVQIPGEEIIYRGGFGS